MNAFSSLHGWPVTRVIALFFLVTTMITGCNGQVAGVGTGGTGGNQYAMGGAIQGKALSLSNAVATIAGNATTIAGTVNSADGTGAGARFSRPHGITSDGTNLYVADSFNHTIRKIVISTGVVTTFAGSARIPGANDGIGTAAKFNYPQGITTDGASLFVSDSGNSTIRKVIISTGVVTTLAGSVQNQGANDGTGSAARFSGPTGITTDGTNLYVADTNNNTIRKIVISTGVVTTLAGTAGNIGSTDGIGSAAQFSCPGGITTDGTNLYVVDSGNLTIRKISIVTGVVSTLAGTAQSQGATDGVSVAARFMYPQDIVSDGTNLYVTDLFSIRKIEINTGVVNTMSLTETAGGVANFVYPTGIATDGLNLYVTGEQIVRKIAISTNTISTLAGSPPSIDGTGASATFNSPYGITTDGANLYVTDRTESTIRKIVIATGTVTTLAGTARRTGGADGIGAAATFSFPAGITTDGTNLFLTDSEAHTIRKIVISTGVVSTLAGNPFIPGAADGTGTAARFYYPSGITTDGTNLYVTDLINNTIRKVVISTGAVTTLAGIVGIPGAADGTGTAASFYQPSGITTDGTNLYVTDLNSTIRKIVISTGAVTTLAGIPGGIGAIDGIGPAASFNFPNDITSDGTNLYVTDSNSTIRKIVISTGAVTTLAGTTGVLGAVDGIGPAARFRLPRGITTDGTSLYVADYGNGLIRAIH